MDQWIAPVLSLLGVIIGFFATAIFNKSEYRKQIDLQHKQFELQIDEIKRKNEFDNNYKLLEQSLAAKQQEIADSVENEETYTKLRLEFVFLTALVRELIKSFEEEGVLPHIQTSIYSLVKNPHHIQQNVRQDILDTRIYIELLNNGQLSKDRKKEMLNKLLHTLKEGDNDCVEAGINSCNIAIQLRKEYVDRIARFKKDGTIIL